MQERLVKRFMDYVQIDSETLNEKEMCDFISEELKKLGMTVTPVMCGESFGSNGYNVHAFLEGKSEKAPILLSSHLDTVKPGNGIVPVLKDGVIRSKGDTILASDDKSGVAAVVEAITRIIENNRTHRSIEILFTIAEEGGLRGSKAMDYSLLKSKQALILDSSGDVGKIVTKAPAQDKFMATFKGAPAHAGIAPENGVSSIMMAAKAVSLMNLLRIDDETTANVAQIQGGGATNIVTPLALLVAEARSRNEEKLDKQSKHMKECCEEAARSLGGEVDVRIERMYGAYSVEDDHPMVQEVLKAFSAIDVVGQTTSTGGGSDANIFVQNGVQPLTLGTGMTDVHTLEEHITVDNLVKLTAFLEKILEA